MITIESFVNALSLSSKGLSDRTGKGPIDSIIEQANQSSERDRIALAAAISKWLSPELPAKTFEILRQFVRRTMLAPDVLAPAVEKLVNSREVTENVEKRLWLSLLLMDLGFNRSIASLKSDAELYRSYAGEWVTLVVATKSFPDVVDAVRRAVSDGSISANLLSIKSELVRQQFGTKLSEFLPKVIAVFPSLEMKKTAIQWAHKVYGYDLRYLLRDPIPDDPSSPDNSNLSVEQWCNSHTLSVVEKALAA